VEIEKERVKTKLVAVDTRTTVTQERMEHLISISSLKLLAKVTAPRVEGKGIRWNATKRCDHRSTILQILIIENFLLFIDDFEIIYNQI
jgi:hypothetical protein